MVVKLALLDDACFGSPNKCPWNLARFECEACMAAHNTNGEGESSSAVNDYPIIGSVCGHFNETVGTWGFICEGANVIVIFINKTPLNM